MLRKGKQGYFSHQSLRGTFIPLILSADIQLDPFPTNVWEAECPEDGIRNRVKEDVAIRVRLAALGVGDLHTSDDQLVALR